MSKEGKKGFFAEFKEFIMRGNIVDMAIGVIIAGAFTKIVTSLTNDIFMPLINLIVSTITGGKEVLLITVLNGKPYLIDTTEVDAEGNIIKAVNSECIYINWSNFIEAIINFILIALVLFIIIKIINSAHKRLEARKQAAYEKAHKAELEEKAKEEERLAKEAEEKAQAEAEEKAKADKEKAETKTTNELLVELINKLDK